MSSHKHSAEEVSRPEDADGLEPPAAAAAVGDGADAKEDSADAPAAELGELPEEETVARVQQELVALNDRYLRMAAEYENYRKRTAREKSELWSRAQAEVVANILDALDDFGRVLEADLSTASAEDVVKGVELVERKLVRELESAGLERVGLAGEVFDPNHHEAIGSLPAESTEQDHTVGAVLQPGYKFGGALLRPAKVQVRMWREAADDNATEASDDGAKGAADDSAEGSS